MRDEMVNNLAKLSEVDERESEVEKHLAREHQKLTWNSHKKWLTREGRGASENAMGSLWLISVTRNVSERKGRSVIWFQAVWRGGQKKGSHPWRGGVTKFGELSYTDTSHAVLKRIHTLAFTRSKWVAFADPLKQTGWFIDIKIISPHVVTGTEHKVQKVVNSGTRLCSYIPEIKNIIIEESQDKLSYILKTSNSRQGTLKMVSEFSHVGIIGLGLASSTILLEIFLGDRPDDFVDVLPSFKLKWPKKHANETLRFIFSLKRYLKWI